MGRGQRRAERPIRAVPGALPYISSDGRVVKALDLKSNGVSPRRFEPCSLRAGWASLFVLSWPSSIPCRVRVLLLASLFRPKASAATAAIIGDGTERGRWEGSQRILCLGTVIPEHTAGSHPHGSGISPVRDPQQPLGAVCAGARSLHRKETLPHVQVEVPVQQFLAIASCPIAGQHRAEPGSTFLTPPLGIYTH